jgi:hypothetical protein
MTTKRKNTNKRSRPGWKEAPHRPLTAEGKRRRAEWLTAHTRYLSQLIFNEAER